METKEEGKRTFRRCPNCNEPMEVWVNVSVQKADAQEAAQDWRTGLTHGQIEFVQSAEATGLLKGFEDAVKEAKKHGAPKDVRGFFLQFFQLAVPRIIPQVCLNELIDELGNTERISVWGAQGIAAIVSGGMIRWFVPYDLLAGKKVTAIGTGKMKGRTSVDEVAFSEWLRTKHGYVSGRGAVWQMMQNRSRGDFARLVQ